MKERAEVTVEKLVHGGSGLARLGTGEAVFVDGVLPGEQALVEVRRRRKGFFEGILVDVLSPSPDRIAPPCSGDRECTGATWPHIAYPAQLRYKQEILLDTLRRIGGMAPRRPLPMLPSPRQDHYRLRAQFTVRTRNGRQQIGFFRQGSYDLVEVEDSFLIDPLINRTLSAVRRLGPQVPGLTEIHINATPAGKVHLLLFAGPAARPSVDEFFAGLQKSVPNVIGLTVFSNKKKAFSLGSNRLSLNVEDLHFQATEGNFYQVNWDQNLCMVRTVLEFSGLGGSETVLDLYCGIGNFALPLARRAGKVIGVESGYSAIEDARENAALNGITNTEFIADDMQKGLKTLIQHKMRADLIVLDPPRAGATLKTLERVLAFVPQKIIYVSCNPATLARDLKYFHLFGFRLDRLQPVDMFPFTYHIECLAEMIREE